MRWFKWSVSQARATPLRLGGCGAFSAAERASAACRQASPASSAPADAALPPRPAQFDRLRNLNNCETLVMERGEKCAPPPGPPLSLPPASAPLARSRLTFTPTSRPSRPQGPLLSHLPSQRRLPQGTRSPPLSARLPAAAVAAVFLCFATRQLAAAPVPPLRPLTHPHTCTARAVRVSVRTSAWTTT